MLHIADRRPLVPTLRRLRCNTCVATMIIAAVGYKLTEMMTGTTTVDDLMQPRQECQVQQVKISESAYCSSRCIS